MHAELYQNVLEGTNQLNALKLKKLSDYDMGNVIRYWLNEHQALMPSVRVLGQIISQVKKINLESRINIKVDEMSIRSYNNSLFLMNNSENSFKPALWKDQNSVMLSNNTEVLVDKKVGKGLSLDESKKILIDKPHNMSLKIKIKANQPARSLKYIFQEHKIPPWERENYPCVYVEDKLIAVIGLADSVEYIANKKEMGVNFKYKKIPAVPGFNLV
jgi:tRNA(Ile)-lysidine synthase